LNNGAKFKLSNNLTVEIDGNAIKYYVFLYDDDSFINHFRCLLTKWRVS